MQDDENWFLSDSGTAMCLNSVGVWLGDFGSLKDYVRKVGLEGYQSLVMCLANEFCGGGCLGGTG